MTASKLDQLFTPKPLDYYRSMTTDMVAELPLTANEAAMVLKAYDHGIDALNVEEKKLMNSIISKLKTTIWP